MRRREIARRFDEIVEFSGVERFLDTPVKRYSSGMYVRLAFAVAAHLEPEILLVDEVLAVGRRGVPAQVPGQDAGGRRARAHGALRQPQPLGGAAARARAAYWIGNGQIAGEGPTAEVVAAYMRQSGSQQQGGEAVIGAPTRPASAPAVSDCAPQRCSTRQARQ